MQEEKWLPVSGYEGLYEVSSLGRIKSLEREIPYTRHTTGNRHLRLKKESIVKPHLTRGYNSVGLHKDGISKTHRLCRIVCIAFHENKNNKPCVNHKDGKKTNDKASNLEWCTYSENMEHCFDNKLIQVKKGGECIGSISVRCTKTGDVFETIKDAANYIGISPSTLSRKLMGEYKNDTSLVYEKM